RGAHHQSCQRVRRPAGGVSSDGDIARTCVLQSQTAINSLVPRETRKDDEVVIEHSNERLVELTSKNKGSSPTPRNRFNGSATARTTRATARTSRYRKAARDRNDQWRRAMR